MSTEMLAGVVAAMDPNLFIVACTVLAGDIPVLQAFPRLKDLPQLMFTAFNDHQSMAPASATTTECRPTPAGQAATLPAMAPPPMAHRAEVVQESSEAAPRVNVQSQQAAPPPAWKTYVPWAPAPETQIPVLTSRKMRPSLSDNAGADLENITGPPPAIQQPDPRNLPSGSGHRTTESKIQETSFLKISQVKVSWQT